MKETRICKYCGQEFYPINSQTLYCSHYCQKKANTTKQRYKCICTNCGKEFYRSSKVKDGHNVFCCNKCVGLYKTKTMIETRLCEICKQPYITSKTSKQRFCSDACQIKWQRLYPRTGKNHPSYNKNITDEQRTIHCEWCGKTFMVQPYKIHTQKYCSRECKHASMIYIARHQKSWEERVNSIPQQIVNHMLDELHIKYENEHDCGLYFTVDNYCIESELMIEVMGTYWHADIRKYSELLDVQKRDIIQDKRKKTYVFNKFGIKILYLWEEDILHNYELCKELIKLYIEQKGILPNYNSFNYILNDKLVLNPKVIIGYMDQEQPIHYNKALND